MEIMIETIDRSDMTEKIIGYSYFPLFCNQMGNPIEQYDESDSLFHFNQGCFQIPVYYRRPSQHAAFSLKSLW